MNNVQPIQRSRVGRPGFLVLPALLVLLGCGPNGSDGESDPPPLGDESVRDSAGILITETAAATAAAPMPWEIDPLPTLALGSEDREEEVFFGIRGLRSLPGGGVLALDAISREFRFFDSSGELIRRVGRKGEGPGEFDDPYLVATPGTDSLLVWDGRLKRFQVFTGAGDYVRTINPREAWPAGGNPPLGAIGSTHLVRFTPLDREMYRRLGPVEKTTYIRLYDPSTRAGVAVATFRPGVSYRLAEPGKGAGGFRVPLATNPVGAVTEASALVGDGTFPEIREYGVDGRLRRIFRVPGFGRPVNGDVREGVLEYWMAGNGWSRSRAEWVYDALPTPDTLPAFQSLQVDEVGWIWAELFHWDRKKQSGQWMIFDPEGHAHGILETPEGLQIQRIGEDFLLGVRFDEFGVEEVLRYRLRRGQSPEPGDRPGGPPPP